ncbi:MAG: TolC family protein [Spirochaetes bacterium]|nr:TolC family protein [Spirochaetota bacterium]
MSRTFHLPSLRARCVLVTFLIVTGNLGAQDEIPALPGTQAAREAIPAVHDNPGTKETIPSIPAGHGDEENTPAVPKNPGAEEVIPAGRLHVSGEGTEPLTLTLEDALGIAITNSFDLKAIGARREIYTYSIIEKWRDYFPSLSVSYLKNQQVNRYDTDSRQNTLSFESNIVLYDGGKRGLAYDIAKLQAILARNDYRIALNRLIMQVQQAYFEILQLRGTAAIHAKTLENSNRQLELIKIEEGLGEATPLNVLEIETKVMETRLAMEKAMDQYATAMNQFKQFLKIQWRQPVELAGDIETDFTLAPPAGAGHSIDVDEYVSRAIRNRKEVESSDVSFAMSRKSYRLDRLYYFPKFSLGLKYALTDDGAADHIVPRDRSWGISFKVSSALWGSSADAGFSYDSGDNGATRGSTKSGTLRVLDSLSYRRSIVESRITMFTAREKARDTREQVALEVLTGLMNLDNSWNMIHISKKWLDVYDSLLSIERLKADMGETVRYELVKKELERGQAAISYLDARVKYLVSASNLEIAMGLDIGSLGLSTLKAGVHDAKQ